MLNRLKRSIFPSRDRIICPYCLSEVPVNHEIKYCINEACRQELPIMYSQRYRSVPPIFVQMVGWSQVGKTVFLQALTLMLEKMTLAWPEYVATPDTEVTYQFLKDVRGYSEGGSLPRPTPMGLQDAYIMLLSNMPRWGGRTLVVRDCAGEVFHNLEIPIEQTPYLTHVPTTFFISSLSDMEKGDKRKLRLDDLVSSYIRTLTRYGADFSRANRSIIVVFSKADVQKPHLPDRVMRYLEEDEILEVVSGRSRDSRRLDLPQHMNQLEEISDELKDWISSKDWGLRLIRRAADNNIEIRFCAISSLGSPPDDENKLVTGWKPRGVLDPYFWALDFQSYG